jgi:hypothetical protein
MANRQEDVDLCFTQVSHFPQVKFWFGLGNVLYFTNELRNTPEKFVLIYIYIMCVYINTVVVPL